MEGRYGTVWIMSAGFQTCLRKAKDPLASTLKLGLTGSHNQGWKHLSTKTANCIDEGNISDNRSSRCMKKTFASWFGCVYVPRTTGYIGECLLGG